LDAGNVLPLKDQVLRWDESGPNDGITHKVSHAADLHMRVHPCGIKNIVFRMFSDCFVRRDLEFLHVADRFAVEFSEIDPSAQFFCLPFHDLVLSWLCWCLP